MLRYLFLLFSFANFISCHTGHDSAASVNGGNSQEKVLKISLNPKPGSIYSFDADNESNVSMELGDKKTDNLNRSTSKTKCSVDKDTLGNFLMTLQYERIRIHSKNGDIETDLDGSRSASSSDPTEKMLGVLQATPIEAIISPSGKIIKVSGYQEIFNKLISNVSTPDNYSKTLAQEQWKKLIEEGFIKKGVDQMFRIYPDSRVHVGDSWTINTTENEGFKLKVTSQFKLESVEDSIAEVSITGELKSDSSSNQLMGVDVIADLEGTQEGQYKIDLRSGIPVSVNLRVKIEGNVDMVGRQVPVTIKMNSKMETKKIQ